MLAKIENEFWFHMGSNRFKKFLYKAQYQGQMIFFDDQLIFKHWYWITIINCCNKSSILIPKSSFIKIIWFKFDKYGILSAWHLKTIKTSTELCNFYCFIIWSIIHCNEISIRCSLWKRTYSPLVLRDLSIYGMVLKACGLKLCLKAKSWS